MELVVTREKMISKHPPEKINFVLIPENELTSTLLWSVGLNYSALTGSIAKRVHHFVMLWASAVSS